MNTLLAIILIVFGILQVILFFKLWGMTNDVKSLLRRIDQPSALERAIEVFLTGNEVLAENLIKIHLANELKRYARSCDITNGNFRQMAELKIADVKKRCNEVGFDIPDIESFRDREYDKYK